MTSEASWPARIRSLARQATGSTLAKGAALTFGARVYGALLAFATQLYLARAMGAEQLGIFVFAWTCLNIAAFLAPAGFDTAVVRFLASSASSNNWGEARGVIRLGRRVTLSLAVGVAIFGIAVLWLGGTWSEPYRSVLIIACATLPIAAMITLHEGIARGLRWIDQVSIPSFALRPTLFLVGVAIVAAATDGIHSTAAMMSMALACALTLGYQLFRYRGSLSAEYVQATPTEHRRLWLLSALPMVLVVSFEQLLANTDVVMLGVLEGPAATGVYHIGLRIAGIALFVFFAVSAFAAPRIAELHGQGETDQLIRFAARVRLAIALPTLLGLAILVVAGPALLALFGNQFEEAYTPMLVLCGAVAARAVAGPVDNLLTMTGQQNALARVLGVVAALNVVANALLIPPFGIHGAAVATSTSILIEMVWVSILAARHIGFTPWLFTVPKHA